MRWKIRASRVPTSRGKRPAALRHGRGLRVCLMLALFASGCKRGASKEDASAVPALPPPPPAATPAQLTAAKVDEVGVVPILEYHDISGTKSKDLVRTVADFKKDLERLYALGYYPITMKEYLDNRIAAPLGKAPVILSFDDARGSQFQYAPDGSVDPNCAVGILLNFAKAHPDFPARGIFYVLPNRGFSPGGDPQKKFADLLKMGFEIGNHTVKHPHLNRLSDEAVKQELAGCVRLTKALVPEVTMDSVALPMGIAPKNRALLASGEAEGTKYANRAVLLAGAGPAPAPISPKYNPMRLPRVMTVDKPFGIGFWLDHIKAGTPARYISDGDPNTITVPKYRQSLVVSAKLAGAKLRTY